MKLFYALSSPFVRKCLVAAQEIGLRDRIELIPAAPSPVNRDATVVAHNPLGKIPTLITADGLVLYDSRVICEYLDDLVGGSLLPPAGPARWSALAEFEHRSGTLGDRIDIGTITLGCVLGYLDFRYAALAWRDRYPLLARWFETFGARASMRATRPTQ